MNRIRKLLFNVPHRPLTAKEDLVILHSDGVTIAPTPPTYNGTPIGLLLTLTQVPGSGPSTGGTPIGMLLTLTYSSGSPPSQTGTPIGLLLTLTH